MPWPFHIRCCLRCWLGLVEKVRVFATVLWGPREPAEGPGLVTVRLQEVRQWLVQLGEHLGSVQDNIISVAEDKGVRNVVLRAENVGLRKLTL